MHEVGAINFLKQQFPMQRGFICIAKIDEYGYFRQRFITPSYLPHLLYRQQDAYFSVNTFRSRERTIDNLLSFNAFFLDIDCKSTGFTSDQILMNLREDYFNRVVPCPTDIVMSGGGLHLYWRISPLPIQFLKKWNNTQWQLYNALKDLGADPNALDAARVLRIPGTLNSKYAKKTEHIKELDYIYNGRTFLEDYECGTFYPLSDKYTRTSYRQLSDRIAVDSAKKAADLIKLCELRGFSQIGERNEILFKIAYLLTLSGEPNVLSILNGINEKFTEALRAGELKKIVRSAINNYEKGLFNPKLAYKYSREFLITYHNISDEEQRQLSYVFRKDEAKRRKTERNKSYYRTKRDGLTKQDEIENNKLKIIRLREDGMIVKDIAIKLNIPLSTVGRYITQLFKEGRLIKNGKAKSENTAVKSVVKAEIISKKDSQNERRHNTCRHSLQENPLNNRAIEFNKMNVFTRYVVPIRQASRCVAPNLSNVVTFIMPEMQTSDRMPVRCTGPPSKAIFARCLDPPFGLKF